MRLVLLHGAPATGKLTVARALADLVRAPLLDNHATIDLARMVMDFGAPGFWGFVHDLRVTTLRGAARAGVARLITTSVYSHPDDAPLLRDYEQVLEDYGGGIDPIYLSCAPATRMARVSAPDRRRQRKIASPEGLADYLSTHPVAPIPRVDCLHLSTETASPAQTATAIARHLARRTASGTPYAP